MMFGGGGTSFITEKQAKERGGKIVNPKAWIPICYFVRSKVTRTAKVKDNDGNEKTYTFEEVLAGMKWYKVFPMNATEGVKPVNRKDKGTKTVVEKPKGLTFKPVQAAERIVKSYPAPPPIAHGGSRAVYQPATDSIQMPPKEAFRSVPEYYSTLFHELLHSTGHPKRLDRLKPAQFGTKTYAAEELVAELGASFLCAICRIDYFTLDNSAAYLKSWASKLEKEIIKDKQFFMKQQFASMKAVRYMMGPLWKTWNKTGVLLPGKPEATHPDPVSKTKPEPRKPKAAAKPAAKPAATPAPTKGLPVGFKGSFFGWNFTIQVQMQIDNSVALEIWENGGGVIARIQGKNPAERETAQHNIWQRISKNIKEVHHFTEMTKRDSLKRIKLFVEALYKDAQAENRRRAKLGSAKSAKPKSSKAVHARYAAIIGKSQPASRVKKKAR
jgi:antirestriction protein ArdC